MGPVSKCLSVTIFAAFLLATAGFSAAQAPKTNPKGKAKVDPKKMDLDPFYQLVQLLPGEIEGKGPFAPGDVIKMKVALKNITSDSIGVPTIQTLDGTRHSAGTGQAWIERLGRDPTIAVQPAIAARRGQQYAAGGAIIPTGPMLKGGEAVAVRSTALDTTGFPPGKYRYTVELRDNKNSKVIFEEVIEFELVAKKK